MRDHKSYKPYRAYILLILTLLPLPAAAAGFSLHGSLKNESAYFLQGSPRWDKIQNRLELKPEARFANWEFRSRLLAWYDPASKGTAHAVTQLKEAYLLYAADAFDLRLGQQQIVWGKTDGLRLLDIVNPVDMREFILDDFLDSRIGVVAAKLNYYPDTATEQEIELLLIPDARPAREAAVTSRWAFARPAVPPGLNLQMLPRQQPNWSMTNSEAGAAWRGNLHGWDVSLNYFYGWKDTPNAFVRITPPTLQLQLAHLRMHTIGGSLANSFGAFVVRGELAVNLKEGINASGSNFATSVSRHTTLNAALAVEWSKAHWTLAPQFFVRHIQNWHPFLQEPRDSGFWTLRIATDFMHERLKPEVLGIADWRSGGWLARPKLAFEWNDHLTITLGADMFGGHTGLIGQFANNDRLYSEARYSF